MIKINTWSSLFFQINILSTTVDIDNSFIIIDYHYLWLRFSSLMINKSFFMILDPYMRIWNTSWTINIEKKSETKIVWSFSELQLLIFHYLFFKIYSPTDSHGAYDIRTDHTRQINQLFTRSFTSSLISRTSEEWKSKTCEPFSTKSTHIPTRGE